MLLTDKRILLVGGKGGVGKTSTTANLASALATLLGPDRVSVVDLDPQNALHWHFGINDKGAGVCKQAVAGRGLAVLAVVSGTSRRQRSDGSSDGGAAIGMRCNYWLQPPYY